jgi:hypothetical protein
LAARNSRIHHSVVLEPKRVQKRLFVLRVRDGEWRFVKLFEKVGFRKVQPWLMHGGVLFGLSLTGTARCALARSMHGNPGGSLLQA